MNKKILKQKAEDELRDSFKPIMERRMTILETIIDVKSKIYHDLEKIRLKEIFK